jgi:Fe-S cluster assembly ATP-binding protein
MSTLIIKDLHVGIDGIEILKGVDLTIGPREIHALMGPNGNGKSTLLAAIMGHPRYTVTSGEITLDGKNVLAMDVDQRSKAGLFLGMQYPLEVSGVTNSDFLKAAINARRAKPVGLFAFIKEMEGAIAKLEMKSDLAHRYVNEGFSGGEKKRNEILQMLLLKPELAMLDEIDSGLDVDALKVVANAIMDEYETRGLGLIIVSHYDRFYQLIKPTHSHILIDGKIVLSGDESLVKKIDEEGYDWLSTQLGIEIYKDEEEKKAVRNTVGSLGICAVNTAGTHE